MATLPPSDRSLLAPLHRDGSRKLCNLRSIHDYPQHAREPLPGIGGLPTREATLVLSENEARMWRGLLLVTAGFAIGVVFAVHMARLWS